ncbi:hypothetical protein DESUT3_04690 [Desulfuromonas versatilis]|uniref:Transcriptional regulator n=1 Tax=Desulfuromonas versatilis TaxID=2802975 RepID=A0ABM8HR43_9BACT|nr:transcriptional regulator [Desulfuromonas versatilis]BCR03400.1 hypothetical protein DESUT3_04690 [Desulfuromonas versatilis]
MVKHPVERIPRPETRTLRRRLLELLTEEALNAHELSQTLGIPEKEVGPHLEHLRRSLQQRGQRLEVVPAQCRGCGFRFAKRERLTRPGKCPMCRGESIEAPRFAVAGAGSGSGP